MSFTLNNPFQYWNNPNNSNPVGLGKLYVGLPDTDPEQEENRVTVKAVQPNGTEITLTQPVQLMAGGVPEFNGAPVQLKIENAEVSVKVTTMQGAQVYYAARHRFTMAASSVYMTNGEILTDRIANASDFGADMTGIKPSAAALMAAQSASDYIVVPKGVVNLSDATIEIQPNKTWIFQGTKFIQSAESNKRMFQAIKVNGWSILGKATLIGNATLADLIGPIPVSSEVGFYQESCADFVVENLTFRQFKGKGLHLAGPLPPIVQPSGGYTFGERGRWGFIGLYANVRGMDVEAGNGGEYQNFGVLDAANNNIGLSISGGNICVAGGGSNGNRVNLYLYGGVNNCHGRIVGLSVNHGKPYNLLTENVTEGMTLVGCHFYANDTLGDGRIEIINSKGIVIDGGNIDCRVIVNESGVNSGFNYIKNVYTPASYGGVYLANHLGQRPKTLIIQGAVGYGLSNPNNSNANINDIAPLYTSFFRGPLDKQPITPSTLTTLVFPSPEANSDNRGVYNASTGIVTIPQALGGNYNIKANVSVEGSALTPADSWIGVYIGGSLDTLIVPTLISSTGGSLPSMQFDFDIDTYMTAGSIEIRAFIVGADIKFGALGKSRFSVKSLS